MIDADGASPGMVASMPEAMRDEIRGKPVIIISQRRVRSHLSKCRLHKYLCRRRGHHIRYAARAAQHAPANDDGSFFYVTIYFMEE